MKKIRIGNDITIKWTLKQNGESFDLSQRANVYLVTPNKKQLVPDTEIQIKEEIEDSNKRNIITWTYRGKDQVVTGDYSLILVIKEGDDGMITLDECKVFKLVSSSYMTGGNDEPSVNTETIELDSNITAIQTTGNSDNGVIIVTIEDNSAQDITTYLLQKKTVVLAVDEHKVIHMSYCDTSKEEYMFSYTDEEGSITIYKVDNTGWNEILNYNKERYYDFYEIATSEEIDAICEEILSNQNSF